MAAGKFSGPNLHYRNVLDKKEYYDDRLREFVLVRTDFAETILQFSYFVVFSHSMIHEKNVLLGTQTSNGHFVMQPIHHSSIK